MEDKKSLTTESTDPENPTLDLGAPVSLHLNAMTQEDWREQYMEDHFQCCLCGQNLNFSHVTNFSTLEVAEEAHCMSCKIRAKKHQYVLQ
jgi:hypothetical protein